MTIKRGAIYFCCLDPVVGKEISKTRPVLVVSNDINNKYSATVTVLPITSQKTKKIYPFETLLETGKGNLPKISKVKANQIRTVDICRLVSMIGELAEDDMKKVNKAMQIHLSLQ